MKKTFYVMLVAVMIITACQPKTKTVPVDTAAVKDTVMKVIVKFQAALSAKDTNTMFSLLANDGLYCGTDAKELLDKAALSSTMTQSVADTSFSVTFSNDKKEIRIAADGNTAICVAQCFIKEWSQKMPVRLVFHLVKTDNDWIIDFFSISFIPNNEDLDKLNNALK